MKGMTTCPSCKTEFVVDVPESGHSYHSTRCPKCEYPFKINLGTSRETETAATPHRKSGMKKSALQSKGAKTPKPVVGGAFLIAVFLMAGAMAGGMLFLGIGGIWTVGLMADSAFEGQTGTVYGQVLDSGGNGISGVSVNRWDADGKVWETVNTTGSDGSYYLTDVEAGYQYLRFSKAGYQTKIIEDVVIPHPVEDTVWFYQNITLKPGNGEVQEPGVAATVVQGVLTGLIVWGANLGAMAIFILVGGIMAITRKRFGIALAASIVAMFTMCGQLISLVALILIALSKEEFTKGEKMEFESL
ncbi:MAG: hypothetical protein CVT48_03390 [Thermoplasmata archaeon HGW-Thermoplasmata-1]|nr:MAG: hypothetical protein CVT48_03390 [Thermoplasmata archaeon HGW-Thermoplasmata-1]